MNGNETRKVCPPGSKVSYIVCESSNSYEPLDDNELNEDKNNDERNEMDTDNIPTKDQKNKSKKSKLSAIEVNKKLKLNLGLPINPSNKIIRFIFDFISKILELIEKYGVMIWIAIPLRFRHGLTMFAWKYYFKIHKRLLGNSTGIHPDASEEYHALTSVMWWGNLFPVTLYRIRLALNQIQVFHPPSSILKLKSPSTMNKSPSSSSLEKQTGFLLRSKTTKIFKKKGKENVLIGYYIQICEHQVSDNAIFWIYGGAYLGGDCEGNAGIGMFMIALFDITFLFFENKNEL